MKVNKVSNDTKKSLKTRVIAATLLSLLSIPCLLFGSWFCMILILLIGLGSLYEFNKAMKKKIPLYICIVELVMFLSLTFWVFFRNDLVMIDFGSVINNIQMKDIYISTLVIVLFIALLFLGHLSSDKLDIKELSYIFMMTLFIALGCQSTLFLRYCPTMLYNDVIVGSSSFSYDFFLGESLLIVYVIFTTLLCDTCAYFVGIFFGKHKMNPRISPKKTWEGFVGGVLLSSILSIGFVFLCDALGVPVLKGILDLGHWYYVVFFSPLIAVSGVLGDLMFSAIKRFFGIKDFGKIIPGHGGFLDRFDSVFMAVFVCATLIVFLAHNPFGLGFIK